jgi:TRAP-type C4-dicarboxylate transport system substrate-binding protein
VVVNDIKEDTMRHVINHTAVGVATFGLLLTVASCGTADPPTKAGGESPPITLTAISPIGPGYPGGDQLAEFGRQVSQLSDGAITIDIAPPMSLGGANNEITAVEMVQQGEVDLGLVPTRIFDVVGVDSFRALQAPFLITSNELADEVLVDPIADEMLAGLDDAGLTGLTVAFDSLRQPVGVSDPFLTPADFEGIGFQTAQSETQELAFTTLGAMVTHVNGGDLEAGVLDGSIEGFENSMQVPVKPVNGVITGNAVVYLKANAIFAGSKVFAGLSDEQQSILRVAAEATRDWATRQHPDLANSAAAYCASGEGDVVVATRDQLVALRAAAQPAYDQLNGDPFTNTAIGRISEIAATVPTPPVISPCTAGTTGIADLSDVDTGPVTAAGDQTVIDGVWRMEVDLDPNADRPNAAQNATENNGTWTFTFGDGKFTARDPNAINSGTFAINGDRVSMVEPGGYRWEFTFQRTGDTMTWGYWPSPDDGGQSLWEDFVKNGLQRVGDVP